MVVTDMVGIVCYDLVLYEKNWIELKKVSAMISHYINEIEFALKIT